MKDDIKVQINDWILNSCWRLSEYMLKKEGIREVVAHIWLEDELMFGSGSNAASTSSSLPGNQDVRLRRSLIGDLFKHQVVEILQ